VEDSFSLLQGFPFFRQLPYAFTDFTLFARYTSRCGFSSSTCAPKDPKHKTNKKQKNSRMILFVFFK
jgi:hypothetical protein